MKKRKLLIPIKYKFIGVLLLLLLSSLSVFFYFAYTTFAEDKKLFVLDLNLTLLKAATAEVKLELKSRLEELQVFVPRVYHNGPVAAVPPPAPVPAPAANQAGAPFLAPMSRAPAAATAKPGFGAVAKTPIDIPQPPVPTPATDPFLGLPSGFNDEILDVSFYKLSADRKSFVLANRYENSLLLLKNKLPNDALAILDRKRPLPLAEFIGSEEPRMLNRSLRFGPAGTNLEVKLGILTFLINGSFVDDSSKGMVIVADFDNTFLLKELEQTELAQLFLIYGKGNLLAHPSLTDTIQYAAAPFPHPVVEKLQGHQFARQSLELSINGEDYLCSVAETGYPGIYAVSQIRKSEAFLALKSLLIKSILIALLILSAAIFFSIIFASRLTSNISKLRMAAQAIGHGQMEVKLRIRSRDEIQSVAETFEWMAGRLDELMEDTAKKARLEEELETARLVQSTLLTTPDIPTDQASVNSYYLPATECGGDFWDASLSGDILTIFVGDATGHGAPAAIVTAVAKSCFSTLGEIYSGNVLRPEELLKTLNLIVHRSCKGKLLMTMCIIQVDLASGKILVCNAGHEPPLCIRKPAGDLTSESKDADKPTKVVPEVLFARGERLGFDPAATYESVEFSLGAGDTLFLYTDGISEAHNKDGKEWGERAMKKALGKLATQSLGNVKDGLVKALQAYIQDTPRADDITFVLLRWTPTAGGRKTPPALSQAPALPKPGARATVAAKEPPPMPTAAPAPKTFYPHLEEDEEIPSLKKDEAA